MSIETPHLLKIKTTEYLTLLINICPNAIKPKHHFMVHYASVMRQIGPLWNICCIRFERKHREGKIISH